MQEFKREKRELVVKGKIFDYYKDYVRTPSGNLTEWDFIHHVGAAAVVAEDKEGKLLLVRQYRSSMDGYILEIPAGRRDEGEDLKTCALRELEEETGYKAGYVEHLLDIYTTVAFCDEKIGIYYTKELIPSRQDLDENEYISVERYTMEEVEKMIFDGTIEDSKTVCALLAYRTKKYPQDHCCHSARTNK